MNTDVIDKLGDKPLQPDLNEIDALTSVKQLAAFNAKQDRRGGGAFFAVAVTQDQKDSSSAGRCHRTGRPDAARPRLLPQSIASASRSFVTVTSTTW